MPATLSRVNRFKLALALSLASSLPLAFAACGPSSPPVTATAPVIASASAPAPTVASLPAPSSSIAIADPPASATVAPAPSASASAAPSEPACQPQEAQSFLVRGNYIPKWNAPADEKKKAAENHQRAIRYRTESYGYVPGFGKPDMNPHGPLHYVVETTFMSLPVKMHQRVVPALKCVEAAIKSECTSTPYTPRALAGIRYKNTFQGGEITNHMYGIAIDVDPNLNSCCGCVKPWSEDPRCSRPAKTEYDRMAMPECWVHVFEKYGFYWLGHDVLKDTMHFDFLGDPEKIMSK
jgi:hypothetical protein